MITIAKKRNFKSHASTFVIVAMLDGYRKIAGKNGGDLFVG